jgi:uncharacterized protein with HEPN domain
LRRDPKILLWDARDATAAIADMTAGKSFADFDADLVLRSAVERQFEAFRNILIHGYAAIDRARVWRAVEDDLPPLRATLDHLLTERQ